VLDGLVLVRLVGLLNKVEVQSLRLSVLARSDSLTGAPNRRTWDHELARASKHSRERQTTLCVAILDLDRFKAFNDTHGHQAGDRLLREAVIAWTDALPAEALLARYGGEEFTVLIPDVTAADLVQMLHRLRAITPCGQTFSAGIALWDPATEPATAVARADEALYAAKRAGRDRVFVHGQDQDAGGGRTNLILPLSTMLTQPIVDLRTFEVSGHELLTRLTRPDGAEGDGDLLDLATVRAALEMPGRPAGHDLYAKVSIGAVAAERLLAGLPDRLSGLVIELGEEACDVGPAGELEAVAGLRAKGARIALEVGAGSQEFARLAMLRPDLRHLVSVGVTHGRGHLLGPPGNFWQEQSSLTAEEISAPVIPGR
jgi:diguanylate cyclase (GGDEF)-like protein